MIADEDWDKRTYTNAGNGLRMMWVLGELRCFAWHNLRWSGDRNVSPVIKLIGAFFCLLLSLHGHEAVAAAPPQLYSKSITVSYTNTSVLRRAGTQEAFRTTKTPRKISVYISTSGQAFMRTSSKRGSREQVGASGATATGGASSVEFEGHSLIVIFVFDGGGSRFQVDFDPNFATCTAIVMRGKDSGARTFLFKNAEGTTFEIQSSTANNISSSIEDGNVFAD